MSRILWSKRNKDLAAIYEANDDRRRFHFDDGSLGYKEALWTEEASRIEAEPAGFGEGSAWHGMVRDGKCSEIVMWWTHHLDKNAREVLAGIEGFAVPLMPQDGDTVLEKKALLGNSNSPVQSQRRRQEQRPEGTDAHTSEYVHQVSCTDCHWNAANHTFAGAAHQHVSDAPPGTCPLHPLTKKPTVWYEPMSDVGNRRKRCDWDYDPPCGLCEGIGGYAWGDAEDQISYVDCKPIALAKDIPVANITRPIWPTSFVVHQPVITMINQLNYGGQFPGPDPCARHVHHNDTELLYYDDSRTNYSGPILYMITEKTHFYQMPTADVFIKIDNAFCICVSPHALGTGIGPLVHDFAKDAVLIGREVIGLEGLNTSVEADHWNKGPHHFWVSVATNQMVRGWQPWNGLNIYAPGTWKIGPLAAETFEPPASCLHGLLHKNISCKAPYTPPGGHARLRK